MQQIVKIALPKSIVEERGSAAMTPLEFKGYRMMADLTQEQAAKAHGCDVATIEAWESGAKPVDKETALKSLMMLPSFGTMFEGVCLGTAA